MTTHCSHGVVIGTGCVVCEGLLPERQWNDSGPYMMLALDGADDDGARRIMPDPQGPNGVRCAEPA